MVYTNRKKKLLNNYFSLLLQHLCLSILLLYDVRNDKCYIHNTEPHSLTICYTRSTHLPPKFAANDDKTADGDVSKMRESRNQSIKQLTVELSLDAPPLDSCMRALPLTSVADNCIMTDSRLYALLQPCLVNSSMQIAPPPST